MMDINTKLIKGLIWGILFSLPGWIVVLYWFKHVKEWLQLIM
ncbi:hypothetical protein OIN60_20105 [Paenibacillus sp. P96]|uniref:Uncharacterized protein n=1 Tax=Paenibacillus zeirhizosphaerae TaxID=2987519 RepID=A0ABT9FWC1_9BACL|nr:hypothetical protein [Paenibacillus sp. P96]MDP4099033.1 hypothetical protein [Paenibacillus sp. P96]